MTTRVAAVQIGPVDGDAEATLVKAEEWLDDAGRQGVQLAVLPEGYLPGFAEIRAAKASGSDAALDEVLAAFDPVPGPATDRIGEVARRHDMIVAFGMLERGIDGQKPSNASVLIDGAGEIRNVHRKIHLTPTIEAPDFHPGETLDVTETSMAPVANMICADFSLPETTRILAIKGASLICGSLAAFYVNGGEGFEPVRHLYLHSHTSTTRAIDNSVYLVMANMAGQSGDLEFFGMSRIIDPQGIVLAQGEEGGEHQQLVIADIDIDLDRGDLPFRLIDRRRPDLYEEILKPNAELGTATWQG